MSKKGYLRNAVKISVVEGVYAQIYVSLATIGTVFITKFALMLDASAFHLGLLAAIGQFSLLFQPLGAILTQKSTSRKFMTVQFALWGRALTLLLPIIPFFWQGTAAVYIFLTVLFLSMALQSISANMWIAWISDLIPLRIRGRFFSSRNRYLIFASILIGYLFSFILDLFDDSSQGVASWLKNSLNLGGIFNSNYQSYAYIMIFGFAAVVGIYGLFVLKKQHEYPKELETDGTIKLFAYPLKDKNFLKLLFFGLWWMFSVGVGAPFWQPFMIRNLEMSMLELQIYGTLSAVGSLLLLKPCGRLIDYFGNKPTMIFAIMLGSINAFVWLFASVDNYWFLFFEAISAGIMWSVANIIATNLVLSIAPKGRQQHYSALYGFVAGLAMMTTMLLSGSFLPEENITVFRMNLVPEQQLFAITALLRLTSIIPLLLVFEQKAKSFSTVVGYMNSFAKVKIVYFSKWISKKD